MNPDTAAATDTEHPGFVASSFRDDIEGLRGVAVLLVVGFHVGIARLAGGYIGVDVFFVISGYLISGQLVQTVHRKGRVLPLEFWARRLARLAPLLLITMSATLVACRWLSSPLSWAQQAREGSASSLYVSNVLFARNSQDYFQSGTSPFLHTWSLSVEEQFYIGWPIVFLVVALAVRRRQRSLRVALIGAVALVTFLSFVSSLVLTDRGTPWAFYSPVTRAWEFGIGALAYLVVTHVSILANWIRMLFGWSALTAIVVSALLFDAFTPMPGWAALIPVFGTAVLLSTGNLSTPGSVGRLLALRPLRSLGRVSYAWYLFHWPAIVLAVAASNRAGLLVPALAAVGSLLLAYVAAKFIERPLREAGRRMAPRRVFVMSSAASLVVLGGAGLLRWDAARELRDPYLAHLQAVRSGRSVEGSVGCRDEEVGAGVNACVYNADAEGGTVVLLGDSHAAQWAPAVERATVDLGVRLVIRSYGGCPALEVYVAATGTREPSAACLAYRQETSEVLSAVRPNLVVLANADYTSRLLSAPGGDVLDRTEALAAWSDAAGGFGARMAELGSAFVVIEDNPSQQRDPIDCLSLERSSEPCSAARAKVVPPVERLSAAQAAGWVDNGPAAVLAVTDLVCDATTCPVQRDDLVVYADSNHLSHEFVVEYVDEVTALIRDGLGAEVGAG